MASGEAGTRFLFFPSSSRPHRVHSYFTGGDTPPVAYPEGFQGDEIPIDGAEVARIVHEKLSLAEQADD